MSPQSIIIDHDIIIDLTENVNNLENGLDHIINKQYDDHHDILYKIRIFEFIVVVQIFILWCLILKTYK